MLPYLRQESNMPDRKVEVKKRLKHLRQFLIDQNAMIESNVVLENHRKSDTLDILNSCLTFLQQQHHIGGHSNNVKTLLHGTRSEQVLDQGHQESNCLSVLLDRSLGTILKISATSGHSDFDFQISKCFYDYLHCDDRLAKFNLIEKLKNSLRSDFPYTCVFYIRSFADSQISTACKLTFSITEDANQSSRMIVMVNLLAKKSQSDAVFFTKHDLNFSILEADSGLTVNLGYLPQDVVDLSLLSLMEDDGLCDFEKTHLKALKSTSKSVIQSKIYKMKASNGSLISLISHWSVYTNPWTKLAEFIAGRHEVHLSVADDLSSSQYLHFRRINLQEYTDVISQRRTLSEKAHRVQQRLTKIHMELWSFQTCQQKNNSNVQCAKSTPTNGGSSRRSTGSSSTFSKKLRSLDNDRNIGSTGSSFQQQQFHLPLLSCHMSTLFERMVEHEYFMATAPSLHSSDEEFFWKRFSPDIRHSATMSDSAATPPKSGYPVHCEVFSASPPDSFGSGPSYHEIARLENVNRLLISQEIDHSSDDSSKTLSKVPKTFDVQSIKRSIETSTRRCRKISAASFNVADQADKSSSTKRNRRHPRRDDCHQNRSHSSASASDLTSANLHKFTKEQEKRHKADWKNGLRRRSMEIPTIVPHFDKKFESMTVENSSKFNGFPIINETIDRKIDKQMIGDLKPNFSGKLFNPLTVNDQDDLMSKCSNANLIGSFQTNDSNKLVNRPYCRKTSSTFRTKFAVSSDAQFKNNNEQNDAFNSLKRKREEEFVVSQVDQKKPINLCLNKITDSSSSCSTSYLSVIQHGVDCDDSHHLHDRINHDFVSDKTALLSRDHHWRNTSTPNRQTPNLLPRMSFFTPTQSTLPPPTTENSALGCFTANSNVVANSGNANMNSEIISSIREATESSLMLNEQ